MLGDSDDLSKTMLVRRTDDNQKKGYLMNYYDAAACGEKPSDDVQLANYDVLFVPKTGVADVYTAYNQYFKHSCQATLA